MWLYAAGFNAWNQLHFCGRGPAEAQETAEPDDIAPFTCVLQDDRIDTIRPFLTFTAVKTSKRQLLAGVPPEAAAAAGTDYGYAEALNGRVVVHDHDSGTISQYAALEDFLRRGDKGVPCTTFSVPDVMQTVAYDSGFAALTSSGQVWTWGDGRFPECLGRPVTDESPPDRPGRVFCLEDLPTGPIVRITAGGYVLAALTRGRDLYCWGGYPGRTPVLEGLTGEPAPVVVVLETSDGGEGGENGSGSGSSNDDVDIDIADVGVGAAHMVVLTADGHVCVTGSNANGQLGLPLDRKAAASWVKVDLPIREGQRVARVAAGPRSSFVVIDKPKPLHGSLTLNLSNSPAGKRTAATV